MKLATWFSRSTQFGSSWCGRGIALWLGACSCGWSEPFEHHPDLSISLFAAEPMVQDPVAIAFAANEDAFVVEMRDYPYGMDGHGQAGGTIKILRDRDGDGRADEVKLFAEGLSFPTSIMAWKDGVLVTAPPRVVFLADRNGDDRAEIQETVLDGFDLGVTDSNVNGLRWGLDNWIHGANGGNGGSIRLMSSSGPVLALNDADFAFRPDLALLKRSYSTGAGFGLVENGLGHTFVTYNINHIQQRVLSLHYLNGVRTRPVPPGTHSISDHGDLARIFPISEATTRVNHPEQAGFFSAAGGMGWIDADFFATGFPASVVVADVVGNLVHRDVIVEDGPIFKALRAPEEANREFIASKDPFFRPVGFEPGPDGAYYLVDMQREVIEHPDYIPAKVLEKVSVRAGENRGRIYRVTPRLGVTQRESVLSDLCSDGLLDALDSSKGWRRSTAHRLLVERGPGEGNGGSRLGLHRWKTVAGKVRGLWVMQAWGCLKDETLKDALNSPDPALRENAVRLIEERPDSRSEWKGNLLHALEREHPRVRFQTLLTLSRWGDAGTIPSDLLGRLYVQDHAWRWSREAILLHPLQPAFLAEVCQSEWFRRTPFSTEWQEALSDAAEALADLPGVDWKGVLGDITAGTEGASGRTAILEGLARAWKRNAPVKQVASGWKPLVDTWGKEGGITQAQSLLAIYHAAGWPLTDVIQRAVEDALGKLEAVGGGEVAELERLQAIRLLSSLRDGQQGVRERLLAVLDRVEPFTVQQAVLSALREMGGRDLAVELLARWRTLQASLRPYLIQILLEREPYHTAILTAMESNEIPFREWNLDLEQRRTLLRWSTPEIAARAEKLFGDEEYSNRKAVVEEWMATLPSQGTAAEGESVFLARCAACHRVGSQGFSLGPNLTGVGHRSVEDLLSHILDPNMAINPHYAAVTLQTEDGQLITGLLSEEDAESVAIRVPMGEERRVRRADIRRMENLSTSLMPEGLEAGLSPQHLRDLIAFLQASRE